MRYYYPKTGKVYDGIFDLWSFWDPPCEEPHCKDCPCANNICLLDWAIENENKAAAIIGATPYYNIFDWLCVLPNQKFCFLEEVYYIDDDGYIHNETRDNNIASGIEICHMLRYPEEIEII